VTPVGVVLAGGRSSRMGSDKALLVVDGVALARRVADALVAAGCNPVVCQGGDVESLARLGLEVLPDSEPDGGPLPAILDAVSAFAPADVVACACDLANLDAATVVRLLEVADGHPKPHVVTAGDASGPHLLAVWSASARAPLAALVEDGVRSYRAALERLETALVAVDPGVILNINRPEDLP
jgi:molybdopterin-guanine dinucleotide biosynthesis protein A